MRPEVRDPWRDLLDQEGSTSNLPGVPLCAKESHPVWSARSILLIAIFGPAGIALALPVVAAAAVFTFGLLREGMTTIQALLGR